MKGLKMIMVAVMLSCQPVAAKSSVSFTGKATSMVNQLVSKTDQLLNDAASFLRGFF